MRNPTHNRNRGKPPALTTPHIFQNRGQHATLTPRGLKARGATNFTPSFPSWPFVDQPICVICEICG